MEDCQTHWLHHAKWFLHWGTFHLFPWSSSHSPPELLPFSTLLLDHLLVQHETLFQTLLHLGYLQDQGQLKWNYIDWLLWHQQFQKVKPQLVHVKEIEQLQFSYWCLLELEVLFNGTINEVDKIQLTVSFW